MPFTARGLEAVHLHGLIPSPPEALTFSESQYAERIGNQEPWYSRCVVDITSRPVVFIGTVLNEALLWQHMELRRRRENLGRDLRPTSLLICRDLPGPRREILRDLRINWIQGTAEEFANEVLAQMTTEISRGFTFIRQHAAGRQSGYIPLVSTRSRFSLWVLLRHIVTLHCGVNTSRFAVRRGAPEFSSTHRELLLACLDALDFL